MKLLLDENLPPALAVALAPTYPGTVHVHDCGFGAAADSSIWDHAKQGGYVIATKDSDFEELSVLQGAPPKVIWLRTGNCTTADLVQLFARWEKEIEAFGASDTDAILQLK